MRFHASKKPSTRSHKKGKNQKPGTLSNFLHASSLLIEAIYLKAKSLQKLDALEDAADECKVVLELMEEAFPGGMPSTWGDTKMAMMVNKMSVLYPQLLAQAGNNDRAIPAYSCSRFHFWWTKSKISLVISAQRKRSQEFGVREQKLSHRRHRILQCTCNWQLVEQVSGFRWIQRWRGRTRVQCSG